MSIQIKLFLKQNLLLLLALIISFTFGYFVSDEGFDLYALIMKNFSVMTLLILLITFSPIHYVQIRRGKNTERLNMFFVIVLGFLIIIILLNVLLKLFFVLYDSLAFVPTVDWGFLMSLRVWSWGILDALGEMLKALSYRLPFLIVAFLLCKAIKVNKAINDAYIKLK